MAQRSGRKVKAKTAAPAAGGSVTRPDILERIAALGVSDKVVLARAQVAGAFLSKARTGSGSGAKASASWSKVEAAVVALEEERMGVAASAAATAQSPLEGFEVAELPPAVSLARALGAGASVPSLRDALATQIQAARTSEQLSGLARTVGELVVIGPPRGLTPDVARVLNDNVSRQQQLIKQKLEEEEHARAGEPVTIRIVYVDGWREKVEAEAAAAKAARVKAATGQGDASNA